MRYSAYTDLCGGGLQWPFLPRPVYLSPLRRRRVVYYCSAVYTLDAEAGSQNSS